MIFGWLPKILYPLHILILPDRVFRCTAQVLLRAGCRVHRALKRADIGRVVKIVLE